MKSVIELNPDVLLGASNEYIMATMYHEALHGYLHLEQKKLGAAAFNAKYPAVKVQPTAADSTKFSIDEGEYYTMVDGNHIKMAEYYTSGLVKAILAYNPNFPADRARVLARAGIFELAPTEKTMNTAERTRSSTSVGQTCVITP